LTYDAQGNVYSIEDPEHHLTTFEYDALGRATAVHRPDTTDLYYTYDLNGNMTVVTNPSGIDHGFQYNLVNLADEYTPPLSNSTTYTYDRDRRLTRTTFPSGAEIVNVYTGDQLTAIQTPEGDVALSYYPSGQAQAVSKTGEQIVYGYDGSLVVSQGMSGTLNQVLSYTYNNDFNLTGFTYAGATAAYTYDDDGLLTQASGYTVTNNAANGLPEGVNDALIALSRSFNGYGEVAGQSVTVNGAPAASWQVTHNNNGQIVTKTETVAGVTADYAYSYDEVGRLREVEKDGVLVEEYRYNDADPLGIRTYEMNVLRGIAGRSLSYNIEDQLLTVGSAVYQYNLDGFLRVKVDGADSTVYDYSSRGELLSVNLPSGDVIEYVHDPLGRRIAKKVNGGVVEKYLWSGLTRLLAVYDGADNLLMRFEYADGRMPVAMTQGGNKYYLAYDQVGSLRAVTDAAGTVIKRIDYDTFGNILADSNPGFSVPFGFAGGLHDRDTELIRFGVRDYDPAIGRWTAKDPIGFAGGDDDLYGYTLDDPVNGVDPEGLQDDEESVWSYISSVASAWAAGLKQLREYPTFFKNLSPIGIGSKYNLSSLGADASALLAIGGTYCELKNISSKDIDLLDKGIESAIVVSSNIGAAFLSGFVTSTLASTPGGVTLTVFVDFFIGAGFGYLKEVGINSYENIRNINNEYK